MKQHTLLLLYAKLIIGRFTVPEECISMYSFCVEGNTPSQKWMNWWLTNGALWIDIIIMMPPLTLEITCYIAYLCWNCSTHSHYVLTWFNIVLILKICFHFRYLHTKISWQRFQETSNDFCIFITCSMCIILIASAGVCYAMVQEWCITVNLKHWNITLK